MSIATIFIIILAFITFLVRKRCIDVENILNLTIKDITRLKSRIKILEEKLNIKAEETNVARHEQCQAQANTQQSDLMPESSSTIKNQEYIEQPTSTLQVPWWSQPPIKKDSVSAKQLVNSSSSDIQPESEARFQKNVHTRGQSYTQPSPNSILENELVKKYILGGNIIVKVGVLLIFFGISFLLKYAIDNSILPIEIRLIGAAITGIVLTKLGWHLRSKSRDYALVLQGGGIGVLMLTTFISLKGYSLISPVLAFVIMIILTVTTCVLAVYQNSQNLARFGFIGGFLAPILASTGQGQHIILFTYYTLLNLGILYVSWQKAWPSLNLLGFIFTFVVGTTWGVLEYKTQHYWSTQPFLIIFFLIYAVIPILFARKHEPKLRGYLDGTIVFGNSLITLMLQLQLIKHIEYGAAFSALILAAFYILLSRYLITHSNKNYQLLAQAYIAIGIIFVTVAIPLAFDGLKTSAIWAIEAAGIYWVGVKQRRNLVQFFSITLCFATAVAFFLGPIRSISDTMFLNANFFSCIIMAGSAYFISYYSDINKTNSAARYPQVAWPTFVMGSLWWIISGLNEVYRYYWNMGGYHRWGVLREYQNIFDLQLLYLAITTFLLYLLALKINWIRFKLVSNSFILVLLAGFLLGLAYYQHYFAAEYSWLAWSSAFFAYYYILYKNEQLPDIQKSIFFRLGHAAALWVLVGIVFREIFWVLSVNMPLTAAWRDAAQGAFLVMVIWLITEKKELLNWPVKRQHSTYMYLGLIPIVGLATLWLIYIAWTNPGSANPLPYLPLLNPLELSQLGLIFIGSLWLIRMFFANSLKLVDASFFLAPVYFIWINSVLCRVLYHYLDVPFRYPHTLGDARVQVAFSIFWTCLGIAQMIFATNKQWRWLWLTGAGLLAVVVFKLFVVDLAKVNTMARIISFIGVGLLFLFVGYFSPIPPKGNDSAAGNDRQE